MSKKAPSRKATTTALLEPTTLPAYSPSLLHLPSLVLPPKQVPDHVLVVAYGRYSSENQSEGSADAQIEMIRRACEQGRVPLANPLFRGSPIECVGHVKDEAISGKRSTRTGIQMVEALIKERKVHAVVVNDLSRSTRLVDQVIAFRNLARYYGVEFVSLTEGTSSHSDNSKAMFYVSGMVNELGNDQRRDATVAHMAVRVSAGYSHGSLAYGYTSEPTQVEDRKGREVKSQYRLMIHPQRAEVVRRIFQLYADGVGIKKITATLNRELILGPGGGHRRGGRVGGWSPTTVGKMLKNQRYVGLWYWQQTTTITNPTTRKTEQRPQPRDQWVPVGGDEGLREDLQIVPGDLWRAVQARLLAGAEKRANGTTASERRWGNRKTAEADHLLSGLLACGACGGNMILNGGKNGGYYACFNAHRKGTCACRRNVQLRHLERAVVGVVGQLLAGEEVAADIARRANAKLRKRLAGDPEAISRLQDQQKKLTREVARMVDFVAGGDSSTAIRTRLAQSEEQLALVSGQLVQLKAAQANPLLFTPHAVRQQLQSLVEVLNEDSPRARAVLAQLLVGKVKVVVDGQAVHVEGEVRAQAGGARAPAMPFKVTLA